MSPTLAIAWVSHFPVEWLPGAPAPLRRWRREHSRSWQGVLLEQLENGPGLWLHILDLRKQFARGCTFPLFTVDFQGQLTIISE